MLYRSINSIAKEHGVNSLTLFRICERNEIEFFRIRRKNPKFPQPFIAREHEQRLIRLLEECKRFLTRTKRQPPNHPAVARYA